MYRQSKKQLTLRPKSKESLDRKTRPSSLSLLNKFKRSRSSRVNSQSPRSLRRRSLATKAKVVAKTVAATTTKEAAEGEETIVTIAAAGAVNHSENRLTKMVSKLKQTVNSASEAAREVVAAEEAASVAATATTSTATATRTMNSGKVEAEEHAAATANLRIGRKLQLQRR
jgi:hypothetical protein